MTGTLGALLRGWCRGAVALLLACHMPAAPEDAVDLRMRVAADPQDDSARAALARSDQERDRPGAALAAWDLLYERKSISGADRELAGALFRSRARARLALGDPDALRDLRRARVLGVAISPAEMAMAARAHLAGVARRSHPDDARLGRAARSLDASLLGDLAPLQGRREDATSTEAGVVGVWLWERGARWLARSWLIRHLDAGGLDPRALAAWADAQRWWGVTSIGGAMTERLVQAGVTTCGLDGQCVDILKAASDPRRAAVLDRVAEQRGLRTGDSVIAAAWVMGTLGRWLDEPSTSWDQRIIDRVDPFAAVEAAGVAPFAAATLLRLAGRDEAASTALDDAIAKAREMTPDERAVVVAELVVRGDVRASSIAEIEPRAAMAVRALARLVPESEWPVLRARFDDAEWRRVLRDHLVEDGEPRSWTHRARRVVAEASAEDRAELHGVLEAYLSEPVVSDRLAAEFVARAPLATSRALELAAVYRELGDLRRERRWAREAADASPRLADAVMALGIATAVDGDPSQAEIHMTRAASLSGDAGASTLWAARELRERGQSLLALSFARRALSLSGEGHDRRVLAVIIDAAKDLGRADQWRAAEVALGAPFPAIDVSADRRARLAPAQAEARVELLESGSSTALLPSELLIRQLLRIALAGPRSQARPAAEALLAEPGRVEPEMARELERVLEILPPHQRSAGGRSPEAR